MGVPLGFPAPLSPPYCPAHTAAAELQPPVVATLPVSCCLVWRRATPHLYRPLSTPPDLPLSGEELLNSPPTRGDNVAHSFPPDKGGLRGVGFPSIFTTILHRSSYTLCIFRRTSSFVYRTTVRPNASSIFVRSASYSTVSA
jgi:hypothetical protein